MKNTLMIVLYSAAMFASGCTTSHPNVRAWEYKVVQGQIGDYGANGLQQAINKEADGGWTLVSASGQDNANTKGYGFAVMKREKK